MSARLHPFLNGKKSYLSLLVIQECNVSTLLLLLSYFIFIDSHLSDHEPLRASRDIRPILSKPQGRRAKKRRKRRRSCYKMDFVNSWRSITTSSTRNYRFLLSKSSSRRIQDGLSWKKKIEKHFSTTRWPLLRRKLKIVC